MSFLKTTALAVTLSLSALTMSFAHGIGAKKTVRNHAKPVATMASSKTIASAATPDSVDARLKVKCCIKFGWSGLKFKRPKKNCQSGFGLCTGTIYACILCNFSSTVPDCSKCSARVAAGDLEVHAIYDEDAGTVTLEIPSDVKTYADPNEDFSTFYLDDDFDIIDNSSGTTRCTMMSGDYTVVDNGTTLTVVVDVVP
jgi:hypothetical protein